MITPKSSPAKLQSTSSNLQNLLNDLSKISTSDSKGNSKQAELTRDPVGRDDPRNIDEGNMNAGGAMAHHLESRIDPNQEYIRPSFSRFFGRNAPDPFNLAYALERLSGLLRQDGNNGPRQNVPAKGFYLNVVL
ncbi:MAG: hypothetical protein AB8B77_01715 [Alphaproteobacteria bacterium]